MSYDPRLTTRATVALPPELDPLIEGLAADVHDTWAAGRMNEGWRYGERQDAEAKAHPGLVPYDELTASEQEYDRATALATLRYIVAAGYRIVPPGHDGEGAHD